MIRRHGYIAALLTSITLAVVSSLAWLVTPVADFLERVAWPPYQGDAHELVALGFIDAPREIPAQWSQFRAWLERARNHSHYFAGGFY